MSLPSLKVTVFFICLCFNMVSFRGQKKLGPRPDRSPLGVLFKTSDEHPHPFHMRSSPPPPPPGSRLLYCNRCRVGQSIEDIICGLADVRDEWPLRIVACRRVELTQSFRSVYATSATEDRGLLYCWVDRTVEKVVNRCEEWYLMLWWRSRLLLQLVVIVEHL